MPDITICRASKQDASYIEEKLEKYLLDSYNASWQDFFVARLNSKTVGFGRIIDHGDLFEIASLGVDYYHRRKGIGVKLLSFLVEEANRLDSNKPIYCLTHRPGFTQKVGFEEANPCPQALEYKRRYRCRLDISQNKIMKLGG